MNRSDPENGKPGVCINLYGLLYLDRRFVNPRVFIQTGLVEYDPILVIVEPGRIRISSDHTVHSTNSCVQHHGNQDEKTILGRKQPSPPVDEQYPLWRCDLNRSMQHIG